MLSATGLLQIVYFLSLPFLVIMELFFLQKVGTSNKEGPWTKKFKTALKAFLNSKLVAEVPKYGCFYFTKYA